MIRSIESHRFVVNKESLFYMKEVRKVLGELQDIVPQVQGIGFFGSRTLGRERIGSDLDCIIYTDGLLSLGTRKKLIEIVATRMAELGLSIDRDETIDENYSVLTLDICEASTLAELRLFVRFVSEKPEHFQDGFIVQRLLGPDFCLLKRFFLGIGEGI